MSVWSWVLMGHLVYIAVATNKSFLGVNTRKVEVNRLRGGRWYVRDLCFNVLNLRSITLTFNIENTLELLLYLPLLFTSVSWSAHSRIGSRHQITTLYIRRAESTYKEIICHRVSKHGIPVLSFHSPYMSSDCRTGTQSSPRVNWTTHAFWTWEGAYIQGTYQYASWEVLHRLSQAVLEG